MEKVEIVIVLSTFSNAAQIVNLLLITFFHFLSFCKTVNMSHCSHTYQLLKEELQQTHNRVHETTN